MALSTSDFAGDGTRLSRLQDGEAPEEERESKRFALVAQKVELVRGTLDCAAAQVGSSKCSARDSWLIAIFTFGEGYHNVFALVGQRLGRIKSSLIILQRSLLVGAMTNRHP